VSNGRMPSSRRVPLPSSISTRSALRPWSPPQSPVSSAFPPRAIGWFNGPAATHLASGRCLPILDDLAGTGTLAVGVSTSEDLGELKAACREKLGLVGNLNALEVRTWTPSQTEAEVKNATASAGPGGGCILSDNHGEIPWQVPDEVLAGIAEAVRRWGRYPLRWVGSGDGH